MCVDLIAFKQTFSFNTGKVFAFKPLCFRYERHITLIPKNYVGVIAARKARADMLVTMALVPTANYYALYIPTSL